MQCLIIAAGRGSRLAHRFPLKPLAPVAGMPLIERVMAAAEASGIRDFIVVSGYRRNEIERCVGEIAGRKNLAVTSIFNPDWERENGFSVLAGRRAVQGEFVLLMSDHLFDPLILDSLLALPLGAGQAVLAVDSRIDSHPFADLADVTRVRVRDGRIVAIGKRLAEYTGFDTGVFRCTPALFPALEESAGRGDGSLSGAIRVLAARGDMLANDSGGGFWIDVDDERALALAEDLFAGGPPRR